MDTSNNSSVVEYYSKNAERFANAYSSNLGFRERYEIWCRLLDKYSSDRKSAIDMGCGSGAFTFYLASKRLQVTGIDASETMIELCKNEQSAQSIDNIQFHTAEIPHFRDLPLHKADLIISSSVLEYVENLEETLTVFHKLLNDDGVLIISFPNANSLYRKYERWQFQMFRRPKYYRYVKNVVSPKDVELLSRSVGMTQLEVQYYAHDTIISRISRFLGFPPEYTENLFVSVFRKDRIDTRAT